MRPRHVPLLSASAVLSAYLSIGLVGCFEAGGVVTNFILPEGAVLNLEIGIEEGSAPAFDSVRIRMVSDGGDTLYDTLDEYGWRLSAQDSQSLGISIDPAFRPHYEVPPLSAWKVELEAFSDGKVVLAGSATTGRARAGDTLRVAVPLSPR